MDGGAARIFSVKQRALKSFKFLRALPVCKRRKAGNRKTGKTASCGSRAIFVVPYCFFKYDGRPSQRKQAPLPE